MEILLSAVLGELASRSMDFFIRKSSKPTVVHVVDGLQRAIIRAQVIIEEAAGRHITNKAMLQQLGMLIDAMHRGCYILDTFRYQFHGDEEATDQVVSHSFSLSKVHYLKGICSSNRKTLLLEQIQQALDNLSCMILDVKELVAFLSNYPRLYCQPYSMHLLLGNCMFERQVETDLVMNFLLHTQPHGSEEFEVLPIVGPGKVGKSTLVAHVCKNERVYDHFSEIFFLRDHDFIDDAHTILREGCAVKLQNRVSNSYKNRRLLVVVDLVGDLNENAWNMLYSSSKQRMTSSTKIIVTSRSDKILKFGTTQALTLEYPSREAFWYFFKTVTFGSMDLKMHPKFAHVAMEISKILGGSLIDANLIGRVLRENFDIHFWCQVLAFLREIIQKHVSKFGVHPFCFINQNKPVHFRRMATPYEEFVHCCVFDSSSQEVVPKIRLQDVVFGSAKALGKFDVLLWTSPIPPYYNYVVTCEVRELKPRAAKRKRSVTNE